MAGIKVQTAETAYAVTTTQIKNWLKVDGSDDDTVIGELQKVVHNWAKLYTKRSLTTQTLQLFIDSVYDVDVPIEEGMYIGIDQDISRRSIILPQSPVASITHVKYYDDADSATTWASSNYYLDNTSAPNRFVLRNGKSYPTGLRVANALEIQYVAGYGGQTDVPYDIQYSCLLYASYLFEHRGDLLNGKNVTAPNSATQLLEPYVIKQLSTNAYRGTAHYGGLV